VCAAQFPSATGSPHYCLLKCAPAIGKATCPAGLACNPKSSAYAREVDQAVCVFRPCAQAKDCPVFLADGCSTVGAPCVGAAGAFCATDDESTTGATCALPGSCDLASGLCQPHALGGAGGVGSPCKDDRDCKGQMRCDRQRTEGGQLHARNGYCIVEGCTFAKSLPQRACPAGSNCQHLYAGGTCFKSCKLQNAADCRGHAADKRGDYECYAWNNLVVGSVQVADAPVCEPADSYPCNFLGSSKLDCSVLGEMPNNPTQMACRDRQTGAQLPPSSPAGFCLDTTASGN
jgi:hypothetical protein